MHTLHVLIGLGLLVTARRQAAMYWHFVVGVWMAIFFGRVPMNGQELLINGWDFEPSVVIGCAGLMAWYLAVTRGRPARRTAWFLSGIGLLFLDLSSPLDLLADQYLFSAHIVQHFVLALIVPPLLILGMPPLRLPVVPPAVSWVLGVGTMVFWHVPFFFNAALGSDGLHVAEHLSFLVTGVIFWLPVIHRRMVFAGGDFVFVRGVSGVQLAGRVDDVCEALSRLRHAGRSTGIAAADPGRLGTVSADRPATGRIADVGAGVFRLFDGDSGDRGAMVRDERGDGLKNRLAILTAVCAFALIGVGAYLTSVVVPIPGAKPGGPVVTAPGVEQLHLILAGLTAILTISLAVWVRSLFGWIALGIVLIEGALGRHGAIFHAILAPVLFAALAAVAVPASESPVPATDLWPPLRTMSMLAPILVLLQISLGAGFRHEVLGVVWHILDAGIVLLLIMVLGVCLLRQFPEPAEQPRLRRAAIALLVITGVQVLLGFSVYLILLIVSENNQALIVTSVVHVLTGSLTLAASTVLALELRRVTDPALTVTADGG